MKMFNKYPVQVTILKKYGNSISFINDRGRYVEKTKSTQDGSETHTYFKLKKERKTIAAPPQKFYQDVDGQRHLYLLKLDREEYLALEITGGKLIANVQVPKIVNGEPERNEEGKVVYEKKDLTVFNTEIALDGGKVTQLPALVAHRYYDAKQWLTSELKRGSKLYKVSKFWDKFGTLITATVAIFGCIIIAYFTLNHMQQISQTAFSTYSNVVHSNQQIADAVTKLVNQVATNATSSTPAY